MRQVIISGAARTPIGGFQGGLSPLAAPALGGAAIAGAVALTGADAPVAEIVMGCVLPAGQGQAPARQAGFAAGLAEDVPAVTLNKMCGSGMAAVMLAADRIALGHADIAAAGGMESMSNAPYLLPKMRAGARAGHQAVVDSMFLDGLEDAYEPGRLMGIFAEDCAAHYGFSRDAQDDYARESLARARAAQADGAFLAELVPVPVPGRRGSASEAIAQDEQPLTARPDRISQLRPAFRPDGTVTAANASSISDGAAALILAAEDAGLPVRARLVGQAVHAQAPGWFTTAPVGAVRRLLDRVGWTIGDVDLWEVNEAFAVVPMAFMREIGIDHSRLNVHGGACALGHPIGASGARILVTLLHALERHDLRRGVAAICIGGGEATALAVERP